MEQERTNMQTSAQTMGADVARALGTDNLAGPLGKKTRKKKVEEPATHEDPREELRRLVREHKALVHKARAFEASVSDRTNRMTGETMPSAVPLDVRVEVDAVVKSMRHRADLLESKMTRQLKLIPIYKLFLAHVFGVGPVVASYLVSEIDIRRCEKISNLRRYCGLAVINGHLERPTRGQKLAYNAELRTRLYQAFSAMWKNAAKKSADAPNGKTSKYLDVWKGYRHRMTHHERYDAKTNRLAGFDGGATRPGAKALIHACGWHKAADVLIEDLYIVWRTIEGLPVWPSYHAAKLGYGHGGKVIVNEPKILTIEEALATVGNPGGVPSLAPIAEEAA
jgi:hypothetical protein